MKTKHLFIAFIITAIAQVFVPLKMVYDSEMTERTGTVYKFKTAPIDPQDPFRGKYVRLNYDMSSYPTNDTTWVHGEPVYVTLKNDNEGFAAIESISHQAPDDGTDYVVAKYRYNAKDNINFSLEFDRYYMEESKAPEAETFYRSYNQNAENKKPAYALVAVINGNAVLKDVIIDDIPIREYVLKEREKQ
ncbi:hypothetical protein DVK85_05770 [Flavobacterium arcticum]|uniref:GDYXXLXY protein n=1 Tax=Flavobacterium arcticum TaxID=1784713 RepID=A0A345HB07_9FLAO|nr:GDYXXLXY domain-containing protein [Flavobacterium arcticum]AXG73767.1 hypothetical protein DVK85_05770 [Flavobacterium arcticum]KAF2511719.1 GDYXXLXY domain-containing protein [Flavobacterium arcticum]